MEKTQPENQSQNKESLTLPLWSFARKYFFEFFIVFFGVYLAFVFTDYQESLRDKKIRIKYYDSLIHEFKIFYRHLDEEKVKLEDYLELVDAIAAGEQPKLVMTDLYYLYNGITVRAAFNSKNFEAIDEELLHSIIRGIYKLEQLEKKIKRLNQLQQNILFQATTTGKVNSHYDENGKLKDSLLWYPKLIREIADTNALLREVVKDRAIPDMERSKLETQNMPFWELAE
jgi:hypothetical protein